MEGPKNLLFHELAIILSTTMEWESNGQSTLWSGRRDTCTDTRLAKAPAPTQQHRDTTNTQYTRAAPTATNSFVFERRYDQQ